MKSSTFPLITMLALFALVVVGCDVARVMLEKQRVTANADRYAQQEAKRDTRLQAACAAGQTGVVLFYKGVDCDAR
jgi:phage gp36-like protein